MITVNVRREEERKIERKNIGKNRSNDKYHKHPDKRFKK